VPRFDPGGGGINLVPAAHMPAMFRGGDRSAYGRAGRHSPEATPCRQFSIRWKMLGELWPATGEQRCWVHKAAHILNKLPKSQQPEAKRLMQEIWMAATSPAAEAAFDAFTAACQPKYDKAALNLAGEQKSSVSGILPVFGMAALSSCSSDRSRDGFGP
jgi:Transposase, Mutator family